MELLPFVTIDRHLLERASLKLFKIKSFVYLFRRTAYHHRLGHIFLHALGIIKVILFSQVSAQEEYVYDYAGRFYWWPTKQNVLRNRFEPI